MQRLIERLIRIFSLPFGIAMFLRDKWLLDKRIDTGVGL